MADYVMRTGALPYSDGSGFEVNIAIDPPSTHFPNYRVVLNPDSEFTDFDVKKWPEVRAAIDRAVHAFEMLQLPDTPAT